MSPDSELQPATLTPQEKQWAMWSHLAALSAFIGVPLGSIVGPLIVWLAKRDQSQFIDEHGRESLNFQISLAIYFTVAVIVLIIFFGSLIAGILKNQNPISLSIIITSGAIGPILFLIFIPIFDAAFSIIGAIKAGNGEHVRFPLTIRFL